MSELRARIENAEKAIEKIRRQIQEHIDNYEGHYSVLEGLKSNVDYYTLNTKLNALIEVKWRLELELERSEGEDNEA